jgi:hypothetical protein
MVLIKVEDRDQFGQGNRSRGIAIAQSLTRIGIKYCIISSTGKWYEYLKLNFYNAILIEKNYKPNQEVEAILKYFLGLKINFIILDGDRFDVNYLNLLKSNQIKTVVLDDVARVKRTNAWRLINPNIYSSKELYQGWKIKSYLGSDYIILRDAFLKESNVKIIKNKILIVLGIMMDQNSTLEIAERLNAAGFVTKIAIGLTADEMVDEIDSSELIICGVSVTLHEVWSRNRIALPVYQAEDQVLFHEYLKMKDIPHIISINRSKSEVINEVVLMTIKAFTNLQPQISFSKPQIDILFKQLVNETQ